MQNYWHRTLEQRVSRRRALVAGSTMAASAAFLAACGGDDDDNGGTTGGGNEPTSSLISKAVNETSGAKKGGLLKARNTFEPSTLDPHLFPNNFHVAATYSNLWRVKDGVIEYSNGEIVGELVESWETSPDKLTITAKLNPNAKFAPVAPVNGRALDAQDVVASWERHSSKSNQRGDFSNAANPAAPIVSMTATDARTVAIKLAAPNAVVTSRLARSTPGSMFIVPKEALDPAVLDVARVSIGTGPYYISDFSPSVSIKFKRNPGFHDKDGFPFIDELEYPTIQEYAQFIAQFRAGNIYEANGMQAQDIIPTKKEMPQLELMETYYTTVLARVGFGAAPGSTFVDERLRQAWVMTWDRDLFLDAIFNADKFASDGIDIDVVYESGIQSNSYAGWLLDPNSSDFGPNSKFFKLDLAEAKKLIIAAGHSDGVVDDFDLHYAAPQAAVPAAYSAQVEPIIGLTQNSGLFKWNLNVVQNYFAEFFPKYHNQSVAPFAGVAISLSNLPDDPANYLFSYYNSRGSLRMGTDSTLDDLTAKAVAEFDNAKRMSLTHEIQRYEGGKNFYPRFGGATGFSLAWPAVRNRQVYRGGTGRADTNNPSTLWLDNTKAPLKT